MKYIITGRGLSVLAAVVGMLAISAPGIAAGQPDGKALFKQRCGMCHETIGMGVAILSRRAGDASKGLLEQRTDLSAAFVQAAARNGIANMPRIPRGEVSNPELAAIASYLSRGKP